MKVCYMNIILFKCFCLYVCVTDLLFVFFLKKIRVLGRLYRTGGSSRTSISRRERSIFYARSTGGKPLSHNKCPSTTTTTTLPSAADRVFSRTQPDPACPRPTRTSSFRTGATLPLRLRPSHGPLSWLLTLADVITTTTTITTTTMDRSRPRFRRITRGCGGATTC